MQTPRWFPFLGYIDCPDDARRDLQLAAGYRWRLFVFHWFGSGWILWIRRGEVEA